MTANRPSSGDDAWSGSSPNTPREGSLPGYTDAGELIWTEQVRDFRNAEWPPFTETADFDETRTGRYSWHAEEAWAGPSRAGPGTTINRERKGVR